jgi:ATP synthase subunit 6
MLNNPLEQFEISTLIAFHIGNFDFSLTNSTFFVILALTFILFLFLLSLIYQTIIPNRWQYLIEGSYSFILGLVNDIISIKKSQNFFPFVYVIFIITFVTNLIGMVPYSFTLSSHIIATFFVGLTIYLSANVMGVRKHGITILGLFLPTGAPIYMAPAFVVIELVSYIFKPISLSVRLFANLMAGHILLKVIAGFAWTLMLSSSSIVAFLSVPTLVILFILVGLELAVSFIQAYVFTVLTCMFINDALNLH